MNVRLRMYEYCYSKLGAIYAKDLQNTTILTAEKNWNSFQLLPDPFDVPFSFLEYGQNKLGQ